MDIEFWKKKWKQAPRWSVALTIVLGPILLLFALQILLYGFGPPMGIVYKDGMFISGIQSLPAYSSGKLAVSASSAVMVIAGICLFVYATYLILQPNPTEEEDTEALKLANRGRRRCLIGFLLLTPAGFLWFSLSCYGFDSEGLFLLLVDANFLDSSIGKSGREYLVLVTRSAGLVGFAGSVCSLLAIVFTLRQASVAFRNWKDRKPDEKAAKVAKGELARFASSLDHLLVLGSIFLVTGLVHIRYWLEWPIALMPPFKKFDPSEVFEYTPRFQFQMLSEHVVLLFGVTYTGILLIAYVPAAWLLLRWRTELPKSDGTPEDWKKLLSETWKVAFRVLPLILPFLVGGGFKETVKFLNSAIK